MISIKKEMMVNASQETAFRVFSQKMDLWWPRTHHVGKTPLVQQVLEPKAKGRWYSTHEGGETCEVGYVDKYEPNSRLVLVWQLTGDFRHDPSIHTEVEVNFTVVGPQQTRVQFEHRNVEKLGKAIEGMDHGWGMILDIYAELAQKGKLEGDLKKLYVRRAMQPG